MHQPNTVFWIIELLIIFIQLIQPTTSSFCPTLLFGHESLWGLYKIHKQMLFSIFLTLKLKERLF